jgi:periplasmic protein TonB
MEANKILSADILDLIFEDRNKEYGAYDLRKTYNRRITRALIITASVALLALVGSILASNLNGPGKKVKLQEINLADVKQEEKKDEPPPPPPPKVEPPKVEMKQFTPPVIKKDEEVEKPPPPQEELKEAKIDVVNQEGIKDENIATPTNIDEGKQVVEEKKDDDDQIFSKVEVEAAFPGGDSKWKQYLERNLNGNVASDGGAPEGNYTIIVQFVVDKEGNISDVRALTSHGFGMEEEAMRVIKKGPKWTPAIQNGRQVKAYRKQPITFVVAADQ